MGQRYERSEIGGCILEIILLLFILVYAEYLLSI